MDDYDGVFLIFILFSNFIFLFGSTLCMYVIFLMIILIYNHKILDKVCTVTNKHSQPGFLKCIFNLNYISFCYGYD